MSDGWILNGVQYDPRFNLAYPFTQQMVDYDKNPAGAVTGQEATVGVDQTPQDRAAALVRKFTPSAVNAVRAGRFRNYAQKINVDLPRVLESITVVTNKAVATGSDSHPSGQQGFVIENSGGGSINPRGSSKASASIQMSIAPVFKKYPRRVTAKRCEIFMTGSFTETQLRTALGASGALNATVNAWPAFVEKSLTFVLQGQQVSVSVSRDSSASLSFTQDVESKVKSFAYGGGEDKEVAVNNNIVQLPDCIFGTISLSTTTDTAVATVSASANTVALLIEATTEVAAITNASGSVTMTATGTITPTGTTALAVSTVPTTGLYLYDWQIDNVGYDDVLVTAFVIDMSVFA